MREWEGRPPVDALYTRRDDGVRVHLLGPTREHLVGAGTQWTRSGARSTCSRASRSPPCVILAGDLNLDVDVEGRTDLFTDDEYLDIQTYNYTVQRMRDAGREHGPTAEPDRRLDYVFVGGAHEVLSGGVWRGQRIGGMDHHPLIVDLLPH